MRKLCQVGGGYTVEGQITSEEKFGGIQLEVTPSHKKVGTMRFSHQNQEGMRIDVVEAHTPQYYGLTEGSKIDMVPNPPTFMRPARICDFYNEGETTGATQCLELKASLSG